MAECLIADGAQQSLQPRVIRSVVDGIGERDIGFRGSPLLAEWTYLLLEDPRAARLQIELPIGLGNG